MQALRVMVADDDPSVRLLVSTALSMDPRFEVVGQAADGAEAVSVAVKTHPDVVVMDQMMPKQTGATAARKLRQLLPDTEVVFFSAYANQFECDAELANVAQELSYEVVEKSGIERLERVLQIRALRRESLQA